MQRPISLVVAFFFLVAAVSRPSLAFAPVAVIGAPQIVSAAGSSYALGALAGAIGVVGAYLSITDAQENKVRIPLGPSANQQPPAPSAPSTATQTTSISYTTDSGRSGSDPNALCAVDVWATQCGGEHPSLTYEPDYPGAPGGWCVARWSCTASQYRISSGSVVSCPSGYQQSGQTCTLVNPRKATDDKTCDILLSNGQFATADDMNCPATVDGTKLSPMIRDGKAIAYGQNSSGQPLMWEVTPGANNYTVKEYEQVQTATQTQVKTTTATVDVATGTITGVQTQTSPGSISSPSAASAPTVTTSGDPTTATNTPTVSRDETKPADLQTCGLPGTPACRIDDGQFTGKDAFLGPKTADIVDKLDQERVQIETLWNSKPDVNFSWIPSLMPGSASSCYPLVFDFTLHNATTGTLLAPGIQLDICDKLDLVRSILGYILGVWTVWYVWRRFVTANQGA